ncbi:MAG: PAS domain-containing protein [Stagnimonas sp.]|nr:PAS domain-containing protein [Stagnimonas sp.]
MSTESFPDPAVSRQVIEAQLRVAQEAGGIGVFSLDIDSNQMTVTPEFCRLFGLPVVESLPAQQFEALVLPEDRNNRSSPATRRSGEAVLETEYRIHRHNDRALRWIRRRAEFLRDDSGRAVTMVGVALDITEQKAAEAQLLSSEGQFRVLAQAMPNQVWTAGADGLLDWFNPQALDYIGVTAAELTGERWATTLHPDDLASVSAAWRHSLDTGSPYETEFRVRRIDGVYRWFLSRAQPVSEGGCVVRWIGTNTDIDDHKKAQAELAGLNASLEQQVEEQTRDRNGIWRLSSDLMVTAAFDGSIEAVNPAWADTLGWAEGELVGRNFIDFLHEDSLPHTLTELAALTSGKTVQGFENRYRHKDGSSRVISWSAVPDGTRIRAVGRDITVERQRLEELRQAEASLRQSQKMESIGQLTGGIAHDFNNLLTGILGSLDMMQRRLTNGRVDDLERFMSAAITSAQRAAALTHRLLAFSRRQSLDSKPVDVNRLVLSMEDLLKRTLGEQVDLEVKLGSEGWLVSTDENQLDSALLNLAINARDAMPQGGKLTIETTTTRLESRYTDLHEALEPGEYVVISVSDTGMGMSAEVIAKAFEPFFTTKPIGQGTGLGLSMIYGFVRQSGGHVRIYSELERGTTVKLYLPRLRGGETQGAEVLLPEAPQGTGEIVLVVEDDPAVRLLVMSLLLELGYAAIEAADSSAALPILESAQPLDLMISDVGLPGMNGRQLADVARHHRPGLQILFITGYAEKAAVRSAFLAPGMQMISKPFTIDVLAVKIREILGGGSGSVEG